MLKGLLGERSRRVGVDFGSSVLRLSLPPHESILTEPSIVVRNKQTNHIVAVGKEADDLRGRIPNHFEFIEPVRGGVIKEPDFAQSLLSRLCNQHRTVWESVFGQNFLLSVPASITDAQLRTFANVFRRIGGRSVTAVSGSLAGLIGINVTVDDPMANMLIDIGSDRTTVGVVANATLVNEASTRTAGKAIDQSIQEYMQRESNLRISQLQAQRIKHKVGMINGGEADQESLVVYGQDTASRLPREASVTADDVSRAIQPTIDKLTVFVQGFLQSVSADIAADVYTHGVHLVGGTARLPGLSEEIEEALSLSVYTYDEPESVVAKGLGALTQRPELTQDIKQFDPYATKSE